MEVSTTTKKEHREVNLQKKKDFNFKNKTKIIKLAYWGEKKVSFAFTTADTMVTKISTVYCHLKIVKHCSVAEKCFCFNKCSDVTWNSHQLNTAHTCKDTVSSVFSIKYHDRKTEYICRVITDPSRSSTFLSLTKKSQHGDIFY